MNASRGDGRWPEERGPGRDRSTTRHASAAPVRLGSIVRAGCVATRRERVSSTPPGAALLGPPSDPRAAIMNNPD